MYKTEPLYRILSTNGPPSTGCMDSYSTSLLYHLQTSRHSMHLLMISGLCCYQIVHLNSEVSASEGDYLYKARKHAGLTQVLRWVLAGNINCACTFVH